MKAALIFVALPIFSCVNAVPLLSNCANLGAGWRQLSQPDHNGASVNWSGGTQETRGTNKMYRGSDVTYTIANVGQHQKLYLSQELYITGTTFWAPGDIMSITLDSGAVTAFYAGLTSAQNGDQCYNFCTTCGANCAGNALPGGTGSEGFNTIAGAESDQYHLLLEFEHTANTAVYRYQALTADPADSYFLLDNSRFCAYDVCDTITCDAGDPDQCQEASGTCVVNGLAGSCEYNDLSDGTGCGAPLPNPGVCEVANATCLGGVCNYFRESGTSCDDGDLCNGIDLCDGSGTCVLGNATICTGDETCDPSTGQCAAPPTGDETAPDSSGSGDERDAGSLAVLVGIGAGAAALIGFTAFVVARRGSSDSSESKTSRSSSVSRKKSSGVAAKPGRAKVVAASQRKLSPKKNGSPTKRDSPSKRQRSPSKKDRSPVKKRAGSQSRPRGPSQNRPHGNSASRRQGGPSATPASGRNRTNSAGRAGGLQRKGSAAGAAAASGGARGRSRTNTGSRAPNAPAPPVVPASTNFSDFLNSVDFLSSTTSVISDSDLDSAGLATKEEARQRFVKLLTHKDLHMVVALIDATPVMWAEVTCRTIVAAFVANKEVVYLLRSLVTREITYADNPSDAFKATSRAAKCFTAFAKVAGGAFLREALGKPLEVMILANMDLKSSETKQLKSVCSEFIKHITSSSARNSVPQEFQKVLNVLYESSMNKWDEEKAKDIVAGFMFVRLLGPTINFPAASGLTDPELITPNIQSSLVLVSKVLQKLALGNKFTIKDGDLQNMNGWLDENSSNMAEFLGSLASTKANNRRTMMELPKWGAETEVSRFSVVSSASAMKALSHLGAAADGIVVPSDIDALVSTALNNEDKFMDALENGRDAAPKDFVTRVSSLLARFKDLK